MRLRDQVHALSIQSSVIKKGEGTPYPRHSWRVQLQPGGRELVTPVQRTYPSTHPICIH